MGISAVITADIVNSTRLPAIRERKLQNALQAILSPCKFEFFRGDSFQAYQPGALLALRIALRCRSTAIGISQDKTASPSDVRISIGIGQGRGIVKSLGSAKSEPFVLSGRAFDEMTKTGSRLVITTANPLANTALQIIADYINSIFDSMTARQALVVTELLNNHTQQQVAQKLRKSKSTINQHVASGRWPEIEKLLTQYENIINQIA